MVKKAFVINLERRKDRLRKFKTMNYDKLTDLDISIFEAIDSTKFSFTEKLTIFKNYQFNNSIIDKFNGTTGELGCFLSHYLLWKKSVELKEEILIFEDDCIVKSNFHILNSVLNNTNNISHNIGMLWIGTYQSSKQSRDIYPQIKDFKEHFHMIHPEPKRGSLYTYCYIIHPKIANELCNIVEEKNIKLHAVDHFLCENTGINNSHLTFINNTEESQNTFICTAPQGDSDIQNTQSVSKLHRTVIKKKYNISSN